MSKLIDEIMRDINGRAGLNSYGLKTAWTKDILEILERHLADLDPDRKLRELKEWFKSRAWPVEGASTLYEVQRKIDAMLEPEEAEPESSLERRVAELEQALNQHADNLDVLDARIAMGKPKNHWKQLKPARKVGGAE